MKSFYESQQINEKKLFELFKKADDIRANLKKYDKMLSGKIMATLFYEPSTRTRLSFETAMLKLGGKVISTENAREFSSAIKGESIEDTIRVISSYCDCIVMRHYEEGSALKASKISSIPIINAGDGKGQHPTQALLDAYTIFREIGRLEKIKIALVGDLLSGRTVRSLCYLLGKFSENEIIFVSPENLRMKDDIKQYLDKHKIIWGEEKDLQKILPKVDIIYITRIQKERMKKEDYEKARGKYVINEETLKLVRKETRIMHPLPHVEEIDLPIKIEQEDKRIVYFKQAENGLYIRMALLLELLK
ncbi:MAG: aspartate carbamoyltransferase [Candidatus ainarchaeum sp.]|nr:aspartate carbamoyltransferase [Candidatus ainarchaeum sp.]